MDIPASEVYEILKDKEVKGLYHANTVRTSKTFLEQGGILSRKRVEDLSLVQTPQKSDEIDKKYNIWNDIFLDAINISKYFSNYNKYGPILFLFSLDLLKNEKIKTVRITRKNPIYWNDEDKTEDRYFASSEDFRSKFKSGNKLKDGGYHIIISTLDGFLTFEHLKGIQIDNPNINFVDDNGKKKPIIDGIKEFFSEDLGKNGISDNKIVIKSNLGLMSQYQIMQKFRSDEFKRLFSRMR